MGNFKEINKYDFSQNIFQMIEKDWMLIGTSHQGKTDAMTASCGGFGVIYPYGPVAFIFVRPQRYTHELLKESELFSLNFFDAEYRKMLGYFGRVSGWDEDKIQKFGLKMLEDEEVPCFEEANTIVVCRKVFVQQNEEKSFIDHSVVEKEFADRDFHYMYIGKIEKILVGEAD